MHFFYEYISKYDGASDFRIPDIRTLQFTDYFILEYLCYFVSIQISVEDSLFLTKTIAINC